MKTFDLGRPIRDGKELTDEQALLVIDEREPLSFVVKEKNGAETTYAMVVNPANISAQMVQEYQDKVTRLALRGEQLDRFSKQMQAKNGVLPEDGDEEGEAEGVAPLDPENTTPEEVTLDTEAQDQAADVLAQSLALTLNLGLAKAALLHAAVEQWNVPNTPLPTIEYLTRRSGPGPAALRALSEWFFPTTRAEAEETGTTQNPNTDVTSASSPPAQDEENTPPTS